MRSDCFIRGIRANGDDELNLARNMDAGILARFVPTVFAIVQFDTSQAKFRICRLLNIKNI